MGPAVSLQALLIVVAATCVTPAQRPTKSKYARFVQGEHKVQQRPWLSDGRTVIERRIPNPGFCLPGLAAGLWFWWSHLERRRDESKELSPAG
jgi:hypothetical protein